MFVWCVVLFVLGMLAFVDSIFNMGEIFRQVNSVMFMLISLGLLFRTTTKAKAKRKENYEKRIFDLECQIKSLESAREKLGSF
jgi:Zn-dependent membrane protease YugP